MFPWMQQRLDPSLLGNDPNQQYQAMLAAGLQSGDPLRQHFMQLQQPFQFVQQSGSHNPLMQLKQQQQTIQQSIPHNVLQAQSQILTENMPRNVIHQLNNQPEEQAQHHQRFYRDALQIQSDQILQRQHSNVSSSSFSKSDLLESSTEVPASINPMQTMLGSLPEGSGNLLNFSGTGQSMISEHLPQQSWAAKFAKSQAHAFVNPMSLSPSFNVKDAAVEHENCNTDAQNSTIFGVNIDSSGLLLPTTVSRFSTSVDPDVSSMQLGDSGFHNSLYGSTQESSELMHSAGQMDQQTQDQTFVKVSLSIFVSLCWSK